MSGIINDKKRLFQSKGRLFAVRDANGNPVSGVLSEGQPVSAEIKYELRPYPHQPLRVEIYSRNLLGMVQAKERLVLEIGVTLTGRAYGGSFGGKRDEISRIWHVDIEEQKIELSPTEINATISYMDAIVFGVVSSNPLGYGICRNGVAQLGFPFSFRAKSLTNCQVRWSNIALHSHAAG